MMHLLFDAKTYACYGEIFERGGAVTSFSLVSNASKRLSHLCNAWKKQGIEVRRTFTTLKKGVTTTSFVLEHIPLSDPNAFQALAVSAFEAGFMVCSLDAERSGYWKELSGWNLSDATKAELIFLAKNIPLAGLPWWKTQWSSLQKEVANV